MDSLFSLLWNPRSRWLEDAPNDDTAEMGVLEDPVMVTHEEEGRYPELDENRDRLLGDASS